MGPRCRPPGHNKKRLNSWPRKLKKLEIRAKRKQRGKQQNHEEAIKLVAGPARTGKAKTRQARELKKKLKALAAQGAITEGDFEMADVTDGKEEQPAGNITRKKKGKKGKKDGAEAMDQ